MTRSVLGMGPGFLTLGSAASTVENVEKCEGLFLSVDLLMAETFLSAEGNCGC